ncbi:MAG: alpha-galactosidase [Muribaculaceae bacterium]|nr:alpha-galactosidase [Muribaculaceae bacterium]
MNFRTSILSIAILLASTGNVNIVAENIKIDTGNSSLVLQADKGKKLRHLYYGGKITDNDAMNLRPAVGKIYNAYPDYGMITQPETAIAMIHGDGNMTLDLVVDDISSRKDEGADIQTITLRDTHYPVSVKVNYKTWPNENVMETWTEIINNEKTPVTLSRFASGYLPIRSGNVWLSSFHGNWGNEARVTEEPLSRGLKVIKSHEGVRNSRYDHSEVMFSLDGKPDENYGRAIGAALCYGGNYKLRIDTDETDSHHFFAGINEEDSQYKLGKGETFTTPALALTWSDEGIGGVSRSFHKWGRNHRLAHGDKPRKVLLNSWEGVYFDINEEGMADMMKNIASMGGELFVMDDGWFGVKYPRNNDTTGLGDWIVDAKKLPGGIQGLIDEAKKNNISFGIWIEPEMVNSKSDLYEKHPEYIVKAEYRDPKYGRGKTQLNLDMSNPKVQDIVYNIVDTLMTKYPGIDYIKWDANMDIENHGSQYLPADRQSHLYIDYMKGLEKTLDRIRAKYPDVTIQACASGGGRVNYGILPWFDEFWTSDNTDALQRIYMQWGTSYFFPAIAMASHISAAPNHQTRRTIPIKYRTDVAMSGRLGMEIQPNDMTDQEKEQTKKAINEYKEIRPIVQFGDLYRLQSPYDEKGVASLMYVAPEKDKAVFYWWKTRAFRNEILPKIAMKGLDPGKTYTIKELNSIDRKKLPFEGKSYSGKFLMENGLEMPVNHDLPKEQQTDWSSRVLLLESK